MNIHLRIKQLREHAGLTMEGFAKELGVAWQTVQQWESGKTAPKRTRLLQVAKFLDTTPEYLLTGTNNISPVNDSDIASDGYNIISQYDVRASMGSGVILRDQPGVIKNIQVDDEWVQKNVKGFTSIKNLCVVTGFGDSMRPLYNSGDPLLLDAGVKTVEYDAIYFFRVDNEGFIKRLQRIPGRGLLAISENKAYESWVIDKTMDFEVFGRVLKIWCSEDF